MEHSKILKKTEDSIAKPFKIVGVDRVGIIMHDDPKEKFAGESYELGEYGIVDIRLIVPLSKI